MFPSVIPSRWCKLGMWQALKQIKIFGIQLASVSREVGMTEKALTNQLHGL